MKIFGLSSNKSLTNGICEYLDIDAGEIQLKQFKDGELFPEILENVRGEDVFLIQSTNAPANDHLMELLLTIDAARRGSAKRITAVIPYFGYARQDRKTSPRCPISAKLVANLLTEAGADRILTLDLHSAAIQGFFDIPVDNLFSTPLVVPTLRNIFGDTTPTIVSPDVGGVVRARAFASKLNADLAIIDKRRPQAGVSEVMHIIGDVAGKECVLIDDMIDSGGTLCNAANALTEAGAKSVYAYCTHGIFSGDAYAKIATSSFEKLLVTNSIEKPQADKIEYLDIASLIGEAIKRISQDSSVSSLFDIKA